METSIAKLDPRIASLEEPADRGRSRGSGDLGGTRGEVKKIQVRLPGVSLHLSCEMDMERTLWKSPRCADPLRPSRCLRTVFEPIQQWDG